MTWSMTVEVVDCAAASTRLSGAEIRMGQTLLGSTDGAGRLSATFDDFMTAVVLKVSKTDYVNDNVAFDKAVHAGTTQQVCLVNPGTIPDGHDPDVPGESGGQEFDGGGCFIVTATTGSSTSVELVRLRALRDRVAGASDAAAHLINAVYTEYADFSPAVAAQLTTDTTARALVLDTVVRPLLAWYTLAGALGLREGTDAVAASTADFHRAFPRTGVRTDELGDLAHGLLSRTDELPLAAWALLDPLTAAWRCHTLHLDPAAEIADWLAGAPIDALGTQGGCTTEPERRVLIAFLDFSPEHRDRFEDRLLHHGR